MIKGGIFHHFVSMVFETEHYENYTRGVDGVDASYDSIRDQWLEETITQIDEYADNMSIYKLRTHPIVWFFKMFCWNPKVCCVPIGELDNFEDFFSIFTIEVSKLKYINLK